ncbi:MAG: hypothetical protein J6L61_02920 [Ruminiclostridium sp.]|nr:hypothetical protein [Ruminiclostridium sp.]
MKVPDKNPLEQQNNDINDVTLYRKKKKKAKLIRNLVILLVIVAAAVPVWIYRDTIFEPLRGIASRIQTTTDETAGYPISLTGRSDYSFCAMNDSFALLSDTYLYSYNENGGQNFALQHGYVHPMAVSNSKRVVIYDKGGHDFSLFNRTSEIYKGNIEDEVIVSVFLSSSEHTAVVTSGGRYSNVIYVYDGSGKWLYTQRFIDDNVMQVAFSDDNRYLYVTRVTSDNGDIVTKLSKYDISGDGTELWSQTVSDCVSLSLGLSGNVITVTGDSMAATYNTDSGELIGNYSYPGTVEDFDTSSSLKVFVFDDYTDDGKKIVLLSDKCEMTASVAVPADVKQIKVSGNNIFVMTESDITRYDSTLEQVKKTLLADSYSDFITVGGSILLMGYDAVDSISL